MADYKQTHMAAIAEKAALISNPYYWRDPKKELPKRGAMVLIYRVGIYTPRARVMEVAKYSRNGWETDEYVFQLIHVLRWMPAPPKPQVGRQNR